MSKDSPRQTPPGTPRSGSAQATLSTFDKFASLFNFKRSNSGSSKQPVEVKTCDLATLIPLEAKQQSGQIDAQLALFLKLADPYTALHNLATQAEAIISVDNHPDSQTAADLHRKITDFMIENKVISDQFDCR